MLAGLEGLWVLPGCTVVPLVKEGSPSCGEDLHDGLRVGGNTFVVPTFVSFETIFNCCL